MPIFTEHNKKEYDQSLSSYELTDLNVCIKITYFRINTKWIILLLNEIRQELPLKFSLPGLAIYLTRTIIKK